MLRDEQYVISLCDKVLNCTSSKQHCFDFLLGDYNEKGYAKKLPVDAYYDKYKLVIEYHERQHTESVVFFDKLAKLTVIGVHRGEQRKIYDERRRQLIPKYGLVYVVFSYVDFQHDKRKRIIRNELQDTEVIKAKLSIYIS